LSKTKIKRKKKKEEETNDNEKEGYKMQRSVDEQKGIFFVE